MSHYQLFRQSANEFVKVLWGRDGEIRELRACITSKSAQGTPFTSERTLHPRSTEFAQIARAIRHASKTTA